MNNRMAMHALVAIRKQIYFCAVACVIAALLAAYILVRFLDLPAVFQHGATGYVLLLIAAVLCMVSIVYLTLAYGLSALYREDILADQCRVVRRFDKAALSFGNGITILLVKYQGRFWLIPEELV